MKSSCKCVFEPFAATAVAAVTAVVSPPSELLMSGWTRDGFRVRARLLLGCCCFLVDAVVRGSFSFSPTAAELQVPHELLETLFK